MVVGTATEGGLPGRMEHGPRGGGFSGSGGAERGGIAEGTRLRAGLSDGWRKGSPECPRGRAVSVFHNFRTQQVRIARAKRVSPAGDRRMYNEIVVRIIRHYSINAGGLYDFRHSGKTVHMRLNPLFAQTPARLDAGCLTVLGILPVQPRNPLPRPEGTRSRLRNGGPCLQAFTEPRPSEAVKIIRPGQNISH